jgi:hypothetical protein
MRVALPAIESYSSRGSMPYFNVDVPCPSCGYNLRGLSLGHGCPECGLKVISTALTENEQKSTKRIDAEIEENLRLMESEEKRRKQIVDFVSSWEQRGERFDKVLERIEKMLDRHERGVGD